MASKYPKPLTIEQLNVLPTHRLLAYYQKFLKIPRFEESTDPSIMAPNVWRNIDRETYKNEIKALLETREHVARKTSG